MKRFFKYLGFSLGAIILIVGVYFLSVHQLNKSLVERKDWAPVTLPYGGAATLIPSHFIEGERFYLRMPVLNGDTVLAYCDTGGGLSMLVQSERNKAIVNRASFGIFNGLLPMKYILFSELVPDSNFPSPHPLRNRSLRNPFSLITNPYLAVPPLDRELKAGLEAMPEMGAFMGQDFFMYKSWTFDYPGQQIWVNTPLNHAQMALPNVQKIGLKKNLNQESIFGHASMNMIVDGDSIDVLFDTGATSLLTEAGKKQFATSKKTIGSSFIAASIFQKWKEKHPDWKYYPAAEWLGDMIEVPVIEIGGYQVGPVLFSKRQDEVWSEGMINTMDKVVQGAIGGSALKFFKVTVDYNSDLIKFERPLSQASE
jgi:hypothetical protein